MSGFNETEVSYKHSPKQLSCHHENKQLDSNTDAEKGVR